LDWEAAGVYLREDLGILGEAQLEQTLLRRGCLSDSGGKLRPTYAGILLFGKEAQRFVHNATILAARFNGDTMTDKFIKQDIGGTLPAQLRRAEGFLRDHLRKDVHLGKGMARSESYEYPLEAARELVVNAVAHRDYSIDGDCIHLNIFRGRMEVVSPGGLPGPMTLDNLRNERFSRNPVIVQVLSDMRFIERLGYGVDRVIALMRERHLREPDFEDAHGSFRAVLHNDPTSESNGSAAEVPALPLFGGIYKGIAVNPRQESAIAFLQAGNSRITNKDLQALYPEVHAETIRRDLADLVTKTILRKLGEKRGSYYMLQADTA
jgi:ATP-dependent DNA helicase RecG